MFGVGLESLLQRQAGVPVPSGSIPVVIDECLSEVELRGLTEVGICERLPASRRSWWLTFDVRSHRRCSV